MVKRDAHFAVEVVVEERDLSVPLTEVIQHNEFSVHLHPHANSLRCGAGKSFRFKQRSIDNHATSSEKTNAQTSEKTAWTPLECCTAALLCFPQPILMSTKLETQISKFQLIKLNRNFTDSDDTRRPLRQSIPH